MSVNVHKTPNEFLSIKVVSERVQYFPVAPQAKPIFLAQYDDLLAEHCPRFHLLPRDFTSIMSQEAKKGMRLAQRWPVTGNR